MNETAKEDVKLNISRSDTYELFAILIGNSVINHQKILSNAKRICQIMRDEIECWKYGRARRGVLAVSSVNWRDPLESFPNTLSDSDFYSYFESILNSWHDIQFRLAGKPAKFEGFPSNLLKNLREENKLRNHLVHSEYVWDRDLKQGDEIMVARPQNSSGARNFGHFQVKTLNRSEFLEFIEYQYKIIQFLEFLQCDFELFLYDEAHITANSTEFDVEVVQFSQSEEVNSGSAGFSEGFEDPWEPRHAEIIAFLSAKAESLSAIEELRLKLRIKSGNCVYTQLPPMEGSTLTISKDTVIDIYE